MVNTRLRMCLAIAGLIAGAVLILYQRTSIERSAAEIAMLREKIQQPGPLRREPAESPQPQPGDELRPNSVPSLPPEQQQELLRLRGEVGVLRGQLSDALEQASKERTKRPPWLEQMTPEQALSFESAKDLEGKGRLRLIAGNALNDLAAALNVPESVSKINAEEGLRDEGLKQYWPYLRFKACYEEIQAFVEKRADNNGSAQ